MLGPKQHGIIWQWTIEHPLFKLKDININLDYGRDVCKKYSGGICYELSVSYSNLRPEVFGVWGLGF